MTLYDELYFEITLTGTKREIKKLASFLLSGELDDFFEVDNDYICYDDDYYSSSDEQKCSMVFTCDDEPVEVDEFDTDEFLEVLCRAARSLEVQGQLWDADEEDYSFVSHEGDSYYLNAKRVSRFNDELDERAYEEEREER